MSSPNTGFDRIAAIYDPLARLVYGKNIRKAQSCFLSAIPSGSRVLVLGGGTGWILDELLLVVPDCEVWYVESSAKMLDMARRRKGPNIHFIFGTTDDIPRVGFNVVITHFFLDLFSTATLKKMIPDILTAAKPSVIWLVADFVDQGKWWQQRLLKIMYLFFRTTCHIEAKMLPAWNPIFVQAGLERMNTNVFYSGFIGSAEYRACRP